MIPRIFHHIWVGPNPLPEEFVAYRDSWSRLNPGWELRSWTEDNLPADLRRPEVYDRLRMPAERSDILRLELLWRFGGIYVDADFECRRPIEEVIDGADFFVGDLKPGRTNNAVIGSVPEHPILDRALNELQPREFYGQHPKEGTGPLFLDRLLQEYRDEIRVFDAAVFYPSTPDEREQAVAVHHMARSWKDAEGFRKAALRAEERLEKKTRDFEKQKRGFDKALAIHERDMAKLQRDLAWAERRLGKGRGRRRDRTIQVGAAAVRRLRTAIGARVR